MEKALLKASKSTIAFGKLFLPDFQKAPSPPAHYEVMEEFDKLDKKPIALIATRDFAKTTLCKAHILRKLCFSKVAEEWGIGQRRTEHIGWVSSSQRKSQNNTQYIKDMLEFNKKIIEVFGNLKGRRWTAEDITTKYDDRMLSASNLTSLRGDTMSSVDTGAERYSCIIADDAENEQNTITDNARDKFADTITNALMPGIEQGQLGNKFIFINTPVHYAGFTQSMIERYEKIKDDPDLRRVLAWTILYYPAINERGNLVWPERLTKEYLASRKAQIATSPRGVQGYYQEYLLRVQNDETAPLGRKVIRYHDVEYVRSDDQNWIAHPNGKREQVNIFIGCDPATDINTKHADFSVIIVFALNSKNEVYVLQYERRRNIPTYGQRNLSGELIGGKGVIDYIIDFYNSYHVISAAVEDVAMTRSVFQALDDRRNTLNRWDIIVIPVKPVGKTDKVNRIYTSLGQRFLASKIFIRENTMYDLENEIVTFGAKMAHDDTIDALHIGVSRAYPPKQKIAVSLKKKFKKTVTNTWQFR